MIAKSVKAPGSRKSAVKNTKKRAQRKARPKNDRVCLLVLGMHRSGTSALTRILSFLGASLPRRLIGKAEGNEIGHWEPQRLVDYNNRFLDELNSSWHDWRPLELNQLTISRREQIKADFREIISSDYGSSPLFVVKDPRICRFAPLFMDALEEDDIDVVPIIIFRNPLEVSESLQRRTAFWSADLTNADAGLIWLAHVISAERDTRGRKRAVLSYEELLSDWRKVISDISAQTGIKFPVEFEDVAMRADNFLSVDQRHHNYRLDDVALDPLMRGWISETTEAMSVLASKPSAKESLKKIDAIHEVFHNSAPILNGLVSDVAEANQSLLHEAEEAKAADAAKAAELSEVAARLEEMSGELTKTRRSERKHVKEREEIRKILGAKDGDNRSLQLLALELAETLNELGEENRRVAGSAKDAEARAILAEAQNNDLQLKLEARENRLKEYAQRMSSLELDRYTQQSLAENLQQKINHQTKLISDIEEQYRGLESTDKTKTGEIERLYQTVDLLRSSTSWKLTKPLRAAKTGLTGVVGVPRKIRSAIWKKSLSAWRRLPVSQSAKERVKGALFVLLPFVFKSSFAFRVWDQKRSWRRSLAANSASGLPADTSSKPDPIEFTQAEYVPICQSSPVQIKPAKLIAFYLPQFHPIAENNEWWGEGFTEWTNVTKATPQFRGHDHPVVPGELGYYDLRDTTVQKRQIELARLYGIEGFCFYFYWFGGKRLLEKPVENWLNDRSLDMPFCLCWANENWSRRWDGLDREILIAQDHSPEDDLAFIREVAPYLKDPRYIRVNGKPLLIVYRPSLLPSPAETAERWRSWCRQNGIGEIHLAYTQSFEAEDPAAYGFDAAIEFPPNNSGPTDVTDTVEPLHRDFNATVYDWSDLAYRSRNYKQPPYTLYRSVCPGWDNTARRKNNATVFIGNTPDLYREWLGNAIRHTIDNTNDASERLIFVNAWNEWAEGAYLEPDQSQGYAYLQATRMALEESHSGFRKQILLVSHDAHPHGAQYLLLGMVRTLQAMEFEVDLFVLGPGPLLSEFRKHANIHEVDLAVTGEELLVKKLQELRSKGTNLAFVNTTVSATFLPFLKSAGFKIVSAVHEMPGVLQSRKLENEARAIVDHSDTVVFAADLVRRGFETFAGRTADQALILPQGLLRKNQFKGDPSAAWREVCLEQNLKTGTRFVLNVAFVEHRKGPDLFVEVAERVIRTHPDVVFIWIGHFDPDTKTKINALLKDKRLEQKVLFAGFLGAPMAYYAAASVFALTSREDPFPNVVLESSEVGVPVVAFEDATGAADLIVEQGGRLAKAGDVDDFAEKISELLDVQRTSDLPPVGTMRQYLMDVMHHANGFVRVSVVVPNFNYAHHLLQRLNSISEQSYPIYEILVLDDCSTDNSREVIDNWVANAPDLDVRVVDNDKNSGSVFKQWIKGAQLCSGDVVWIAEADDFADNDFLDELAPSFTDNTIVAAYSQSRQVDGNGKVLATNYLDYTDDISDAWHSDFVRDGAEEIRDGMAVKNTIPNVSGALFRRDALVSAIEEAGDRLFSLLVAGDWYIYLNLLKNGRVRYSSRPLNNHRRHEESVTKSSAKAKHYEEVADMQALARSLVQVPPATNLASENWLEHVRSYLDLPTGSAIR